MTTYTGYAPLDSSTGKVPSGFLPADATGGNAIFGDGSDSASDTLTKAITGFTNAGAGNMAFTVATTLTGFDFYVGGTVTISGTANYNGTYTINGSGFNSFNFVHADNGTETGSVTGDVKLQKDMFFDNINVANKIIKTNAFRWFAKTKVTIANGRITAKGDDGISGSRGEATNSGTLGPNPTVNAAGGNGSATVPQDGNSIYALGLGGAGGRGGDGDFSTPGHNGGTVVAPSATQGTMRQLPQLFLGYLFYAGSVGAISGGAGGGGACGWNGFTGGGGGAGGGINIFGAKEIEITGTGSIDADGGVGANGQSGGTGTGGGGGGGGGFLGGVYGKLTVPGTIASSLHANGGLGGLKNGNGTNGAAGSVGTVVLIQN